MSGRLLLTLGKPDEFQALLQKRETVLDVGCDIQIALWWDPGYKAEAFQFAEFAIDLSVGPGSPGASRPRIPRVVA
jgi:hypothetical protein